MCALGRRPVVRLVVGCHNPPPPPNASGVLFWLHPSTPPQSPPTFSSTDRCYIVTEMTGLRNGGGRRVKGMMCQAPT